MRKCVLRSTDGSRPATPAAAGEEIDGRISVASRRFTPAPPVIPEEHAVDNVEEPPPLQDQTTLLHDDEESFALPPIDASILKGKLFLFLFFVNRLIKDIYSCLSINDSL